MKSIIKQSEIDLEKHLVIGKYIGVPCVIIQDFGVYRIKSLVSSASFGDPNLKRVIEAMGSYVVYEIDELLK